MIRALVTYKEINLRYSGADHQEHIVKHFQKCGDWAQERNYFFEWLCAGEFHWFFVQGLDAIKNEFYVPGVSSLLNGIEASLRVTITQISSEDIALPEPSQYKVLSNNLIKQAKELGLPVELLAFPGEDDFHENLESVKPNKVDVCIVKQRNNICHGNIFEFINSELGPENSFFTPVSLKPLAESLLTISFAWAQALGKFRRQHQLLDHDNLKIPEPTHD